MTNAKRYNNKLMLSHRSNEAKYLKTIGTFNVIKIKYKKSKKKDKISKPNRRHQ